VGKAILTVSVLPLLSPYNPVFAWGSIPPPFSSSFAFCAAVFHLSRAIIDCQGFSKDNVRMNARRSQMPEIDRAYVASTGDVPEGMHVITDSMPLQVLEVKQGVISESNGQKGLPAIQITGIFQRSDKKNANGRKYPQEVLKKAVESIQEDLNARRVLGEYDHPCFCLTTETIEKLNVLTVNGWQKFKDIKVGGYVWSRVEGKMMKSRVNAIVDRPYDGPAYHVKNRNIDCVFTPDHKFLLTKRPDQGDMSDVYVKIQQIFENRKNYSHSPIPRTAEWLTETSDEFVIPGLPTVPYGRSINYFNNDVTADLRLDARLFAGFLGIYLSEGSLASSPYTVVIHQKDQDLKQMIKERLLSRFPDNLRWTEIENGFLLSDARLYHYLKPLGDKYNKFIPHDVKQLSSECLEELLYWFIVGDGRMVKADEHRGGSAFHSCKVSAFSEGEGNTAVLTEPQLELGKYSRMSLFTVSRRLIQDLHECLIKTGRCGKMSTIITKEDYIFADHLIKAENKSPLYQLSISRSQFIHMDTRFLSVEPVHHVGQIYCLTTEHGNFYVEHKGHSFWTGNCDAKIHSDRVSHLITKLWMEGPIVFGQAEILYKLPCGEMLKGLFEHNVQMGISSRGIGDMEVTEDEDGETYVVQDGYRFVTFDAVAEPSVPGGRLMVMESRQKIKKAVLEAKLQQEKMLLEEIKKRL
jgi:hypothetical protein